MALDIEALLEPVSEDKPCGEDLSYDHARHQIEQAFQDGDVGEDGSVSETDADWRQTVKLIDEQFGQTKDIWLATYLCRAGARSGSLETIEIGAQVLAGLMERYWETVHPQLDELGFPGRKAPCDALASRRDFLGPLERVVLVAHPRLGQFSGLDFARFHTGAEAEDGYGLFRAAIDDLGDEALSEAILRLDRIEDGLRRADRVFTAAANAEDEPSPNYAAAYSAIGGLRQAIGAFLRNGEAPTDETEDLSEGPAESGGGRATQRLSGSVESREDVIRALDQVADYYRRREPSHPLQILVERAKAWVGMDYLELIKDIAPEGIDQAIRLLRRRREDDD